MRKHIILAASALAMIAAGLLMFGTEGGRSVLSRTGIGIAGYFAGFELRCRTTEGSLFSSITCSDFVLADGDGVFAAGRRLHVSWRPAGLARGAIRIGAFHVSDAVLTRIPESGGETEPLRLPDWPAWNIGIDGLRLERLTVRLANRPEICFGGTGRFRADKPVLLAEGDFRRCGGNGQLRFAADYAGKDLSLDIAGADDGDVAASLLGWPETGATSLRVSGRGPLERFAGTLQARAQNAGEANVDLETSPVAGGIGLTLSGDIAVAPERSPQWLQGRAGRISLRAQRAPDGGIAVQDGVLSWGKSEAQFHLSLDETGQRLSGRVQARLIQFRNGIAFSSAQIDAAVSGRTDSPAIAATFSAENAHADFVEARAVRGRFNMRRARASAPYMVSLAGEADALRIGDGSEGLLGARALYDFSAEYRPRAGRINFTGDVDAEYANLRLTAQLSTDPAREGQAVLTVSVRDGAALGDMRVPGGAVLTVDGSSLTLAGNVRANLSLEGPMLALRGNFTANQGDIAEARFETSRANAALLSRATGLTWKGAPSARGRFDGRGSPPQWSVDADIPGIAAGDFSAANVRARLRFVRRAGRWNGATALTADTSAGGLRIAADILHGNSGNVRIALRDSSFAGATLTGTASAPDWSGAWTGRFEARDALLAPLSQLLDSPVTGKGAVAIDLGARGGAQIAEAEIALSGVGAGNLLASADVNASLTYDSGKASANMRLSLKDRDAQLTASADADLDDPVTVTFRTLEGRWSTTALRLVSPSDLVLRGNGFAMSPAVFDVAGGRAELSADGGDGALNARARMAAVPLQPVAEMLNWPKSAEGRIDANATLQLGPASNQGAISLSANNVSFAADARDLTPVDVVLQADWDGRTAVIAGRATGLDGTPALLNARVPLARKAGSYAVEIPGSGAVSARLTASARAERLFALLPLPEHRVSGLLAMSLNVDGDMSNPNIEGQATLTEGAYESFDVGLSLKGLDLRVQAEPGGRLALAGRATDGGRGRYGLTGQVGLARAGRPTFDINLSAADADLVRTDAYIARGNANLNLARAQTGPTTVRGKVVTSEVRIDLGQPLPEGLVEISVIEINRPPGLGIMDEGGGKDVTFDLAQLDVSAEMPNRVYVAGYGVDAEFRGQFHVRGTAGNPDITGQLDLVRGQAEFVGRTFALESGTIRVDPSAPGYARARIVGVHAQDDLTVRATVSGSASSPTLELSSVPVLPRDEILSRLYFGRTSPSLSAYEAVQLAQLSGVLGGLGGGGGGGLMAFARRITGLDVVRVDTAAPGSEAGTRLSVGKYVTDKTYVGVGSGADTSSASVVVEVEVLPDIKARVETGAEAQRAIGLQWTHDY